MVEMVAELMDHNSRSGKTSTAEYTMPLQEVQAVW